MLADNIPGEIHEKGYYLDRVYIFCENNFALKFSWKLTTIKKN